MKSTHWEKYQEALADAGDSPPTRKDQARILRHLLAELDLLPSALRYPLIRVEEGTEVPGTAPDLISAAEDVLRQYQK